MYNDKDFKFAPFYVNIYFWKWLEEVGADKKALTYEFEYFIVMRKFWEDFFCGVKHRH